MFYHIIRFMGKYLDITEDGGIVWRDSANDAYRFPGLASAKHWGDTLFADLDVEYWPMPYRKD